MENLVVNTKKNVTLEKFNSTLKINASSEIKTILNVSARAVINSVDQMNNVVTLSGKIFANVIYQNFENQIMSADETLDFIEKQQMVVSLSEMIASDELDILVDAFSGTEILCSVTHNINIFGIYNYEIADFVGENTAFVLNKKELLLNKLIGVCKDSFVVAEEVESNIQNMRVLSSEAKIVSFEASAAVDKIIIDGRVLVETIYADNDSVSTNNKEFEFRQEVEMVSAMPNMQTFVCIKPQSVTVTPELKDDKTNIVYAIDLFAKAYVYEENAYEVAVDMFSLDSEIQNTYDYLEIQKHSSTKQQSDLVMSSTNISEIENFDDIVGVYSPKVVLKNITNVEGKLLVDYEISAYALYKSSEDVKRLDIIHSARIECEKEFDEILNSFDVTAEITSFKVKAGKELEIAFKLRLNAMFDTAIIQSFVKSFEIKDSKSVSNAGIKVYVTKAGETVFDVAKILNVRPEIIEEQNEIDGVFDQGEKIYVYSQVNCL